MENLKDNMESYILSNPKIKGGKDYSIAIGADPVYRVNKIWLCKYNTPPEGCVIFADLSRKDVVEIMGDPKSPYERGHLISYRNDFKQEYKNVQSSAINVWQSRMKVKSYGNTVAVDNGRVPYDGTGMGHFK